jgi:hypothetical protein
MTSVSVGFIAFGFASFVSGCFRTTTALFGPLLFLPGFGSRWGFHNGQRSAAFDADFEFGGNVGVQAEFDFVFAKNPNGVFEVNLPFVEADVELRLKLIGNHSRGDRAEHFAVLASLDGDNANEFGETLGELGHRVELVRFALGAALLEHFKAAFVRSRDRDRKTLRKEVVAGVTSRDLDLVRLAAEANDVVR